MKPSTMRSRRCRPMTDGIAVPDQLLRALEELQTHNAQLTHALESRVVIEQAKGVLAERYSLPMAVAFDILRRSARTNRLPIHDLAARVVMEESTPVEVALTLAKTVSVRR
jgi:AmiR/NasT family two-component response regulator